MAHKIAKKKFFSSLLQHFKKAWKQHRTKRIRFKVTDFKPLEGGFSCGNPTPQRLSMFWSFWDKSSKWNCPQVGGRGSENLVGLNFWPLFVTKNGILRFSAFGLIKWSWIKSSKWNYPQFRGCGSNHFIGLNFLPLFVTRNGILRFSAFGWTKWSWLKNSKWNHPKYRDHDSEILVELNFLPLFVTKHCIFCFSAFGSIYS